ncbi:gamma-glutamylcyclotransferase family protein [Robertkochia solimangrovi]|uniref:gamma-glutamylcyclotransferase family protein n=1 Tax=Robertkochia solimangrovi TaxID=2213046 RepID=UPI00117FF6CB|nr:gamma-glutamylcyclotransferase family protein [Robertkochia solimangrovi]TRZ42829.1 hypothetical protein DMZ48_12220 [Robertkochia solimangrovi]
MTPPIHHLFVYGTLRTGFDNRYARYLHTHGTYLGVGRIPGKLYDLGSFPGAVFLPESESVVQGDVFSVDPGNERLFELMDEYEGIDDPDFNYYERKMIGVELEGSVFQCLSYALIRDTNGLKQIEAGDYIAYLDRM